MKQNNFHIEQPLSSIKF